MSQIVIDYDHAKSCIVLRGTVTEILQDPVVASFARQHSAAQVADDVLLLPTNEAELESRYRAVCKFLEYAGALVSTEGALSGAIKSFDDDNQLFREFTAKAAAIWRSEFDTAEFSRFVETVRQTCPGRIFYRLQILAAFHLAFSQNACNFSVPGAGKTSIVYAAFAYLNSLNAPDAKHVDRLLIVGPLSSFRVWEQEYAEIFGRKPISKRISGILPLSDRRAFLRNQTKESQSCNLVMTSYQTLANHFEDFSAFLKNPRLRTMFVLDEAHYIKRADGVWASAALDLARYVAARVILTGTPVPNGYEDLINMFSFLYPGRNVIGFSAAALASMSEGQLPDALPELKATIRPFYTRIRKQDLNLPEIREVPVKVALSPEHEEIYRYVERTFMPLMGAELHSPSSVLLRARLVRLRQAATNPELLLKPLEEEGLVGVGYDHFSLPDARILSLIEGFESKNRLQKIQRLRTLISELLPTQPKILIWSIFIRNLHLIRSVLADLVPSIHVVSGITPIQGDEMESTEDLVTREKIIDEFLKPGQQSILIANPQAIGESISLHKGCHVAIYFDRDFNAGRFIQSKDRIHRYGLPSGILTHYYYFVSDETVEEDIHHRLMFKERRLMELIDADDIPLFQIALGNAAEEMQRDVITVMESYERRALHR